ncbi:NADPH-dependent FMN reductase [Halopseudomonas pelagia]|uniref:NADPH-dependent FMN reductase n=1 Tax=Halopseudomonas pelagia TaxID=553151 RepID=UPI0003A8A29A|nr:NAD(P)H-dependent oxidoreductase [Halopseudomonas pelagia]
MPNHFLIFLGTTRDSTPPRPAHLGLRVARACLAYIEATDNSAELIDPLDYDLGTVFKPHFAYAAGKAPAALDSLAEKIQAADGYVMVSPEYNHSMSPALAHLLNHFGSSLFSYKPSAIVTYSAGQWGGVRAAVGMRSFLSEMGCLPVSAMIHVPEAQNVLNEDGSWSAETDSTRWDGYLARTFEQLDWWASATQHQRAEDDPQQRIPAFNKSPTQRNAP